MLLEFCLHNPKGNQWIKFNQLKAMDLMTKDLCSKNWLYSRARKSPDITESESWLDCMGRLSLNRILGQQTGKSELLPLSVPLMGEWTGKRTGRREGHLKL